MADLQRLEQWLRQLERDGLRRHPDAGEARAEASERARQRGRELLDVSSNDYLRLGSGAVSRETVFSLLPSGPGAGASRLVHGTRIEHLSLERELAAWVHCSDALLFASGYALNVSTVPALLRPGDAVFSDALNHASLVDGCRLARATVHVYPHLDLIELERLLTTTPAEQRLVVTESYFSMDGDGPDLPALRALCDRYGAWLYVDEAHALGVFGPEGAGLCAAAGIRPDILVGTLGKSIGTQGAFAAGATVLREWLWNRARGFVYSTAPSPLLSSLTSRQLTLARQADGQRAALERAGHRFRAALDARSLRYLPSFGPIVPVLVSSSEAALVAAQRLRDLGILTQAIRPPTVPAGTARLRITLHAALRDPDLDYLADALTHTLSS